MTTAGKTVVAFGIYMATTGVILVVAPNVLLALVGLPPTTEVWLRVLGMFMIIVAYYYYRAALRRPRSSARACTGGRRCVSS